MTRTSRKQVPLLATTVVIAVAWIMSGLTRPSRPETSAYMTRVARAIDQVPPVIAGRVAENVPVPEAAIKLLKPNNELSRRYTDTIDGTGYSLLLVHCGDARDMQGHYPPKCYPGRGWILSGHGQRVLTVQAGEFEIPVTEYMFVREDGLFRSEIYVYNTFVLPTEASPFCETIEKVEAAARNPAVSTLGALQVQIAVSASVPEDVRQAMVHDAMGELPPLIAAVSQGVQE